MTSPLHARICLLLFGALFVGQACGGTRAGTRLDAADGSGGVGTGGVGTGGVGTGGMGAGDGGSVAMGTGGTKVGSGGSVATGGSVGSGGTVTGTGGAVTGGMVATGGTLTSAGGSVSSGGTLGTGGSRSTGGSGGSPSGDAGTTACTCAGGTTTWDCFCSMHSCSLTLSYYQPDGGTGPYSILEEYANCNLVVVSKTTNLAGGVWVFDRTTGRLVGERYESDVPDACPFAPDGSANRTLSAGQFPDASCVRSRCANGSYPSRTNCPDGGT